jgi:hypothetical protein
MDYIKTKMENFGTDGEVFDIFTDICGIKENSVWIRRL